MTDYKVGLQVQNNVREIKNNQSINTPINRIPAGADFGTLLKEQLSKNSPVQFSKHAQERVQQRGIQLTPALMENLNSAVSKARDKGAKDVVVIDTNKAFIVNVPNNMVVTTISGNEMKENVFTNIDSAVII